MLDKKHYDGDRNLTALRTMAAGDASVEKILADNTYRYNKNGQRTEKTTLAGTTKYTYDVLGQLIQENNHIYTNQGNNLIPSGITIQAQGNGGLNIFQTILNRK